MSQSIPSCRKCNARGAIHLRSDIIGLSELLLLIRVYLGERDFLRLRESGG